MIRLLSLCMAMQVGMAFACSTIIVGRDANESGRVLVGHNEDDEGELSVHYSMVPVRGHGAGERLPAESECARIPQVPKTEAFFWGEVRSPDGGLPNADSFLNGKGVFLVSNNAGCCPPQDDEDTLTEGGLKYNLRRAVGERAQSARHAVDVITNLVTTWGYAMPGRMYTVADSNEAWVVEIVHGRRFVARRCPDDAVVVIPNCYTVRQLQSGDIVSPGVARRAAADTKFDFAATFQGAGRMNRETDVLRFRHMYRIAAGRQFVDCPFSAKPRRKVRPADLMSALSTHYEGTPDEMSPKHGAPNRTWLPVCRDSTVSSTVCSFGASLEKTELLLATGSPCMHGYRAFYPFGDGLPVDLDETSTAVARLESHVLPDADRGGSGK